MPVINNLSISDLDLCDIANGLEDDEKNIITFTSQDLIETMEYFNNNNQYSLLGLIEYFNKKYECNKVIDLLKLVIEKGIPLIPKLIFKPVTEKCRIENGSFKLSQQPYPMDGFYFLNNLVVVKYDSGTYDFFDDVKFDENSMMCFLGNDKTSGTATVSYFVLDTDTIGGTENLI